MTIMEWYNVVAIIVGILFLVWLRTEEIKGSNGAIDEWWATVTELFILALAVIFYAIWGGIFWW